MIRMRSWLTVADNSGAKQLTMILPLGGDTGLRAGLGDVITASVKEAAPDSAVKAGQSCTRRGGSHSQGASPPRWHLHPL